MLSKTNILKQSSYLLMKTSQYQSDGRLTARKTMVQLQSSAIYLNSGRNFSTDGSDVEEKIVKFSIKKKAAFQKTTSSGEDSENISNLEEELGAEVKTKPAQAKGIDAAAFFGKKTKEESKTDSSTSTSGTSSSELSGQEKEREKGSDESSSGTDTFEFSSDERISRRAYLAEVERAKNPQVIDPENGLPFLSQEQFENFEAYNMKIEEEEPKMQSPFNKQQYNAWRKEVDKETIRTQMKLEHYQKSEQLLQAIKARLQSVKSKDDQKELQEYLLSKIGYKNEAYTDLLANQLTQPTPEARNESKRQNMLKSQQQAEDFLSSNDMQVRDSTRMRSVHSWDRDAFVPASEVDIVTRQQYRRIVTQAEYVDVRNQEIEHLLEHQKLWDQDYDKMTEDQAQKVMDRKLAASMFDDPDLIQELRKDMILTPEEIEESKNHEKMGLQWQKTYLQDLDTRVTQLEEELVKESEEDALLEEQHSEESEKLVKMVEADDAVDPNTIKTDSDIDGRNFDLTDDVTMSDGYREQELKRKQETIEEQESHTEISELEMLEKEQGTELLAHAYNTVSESEEARVDALIKAQPEAVRDIVNKLDEIEMLSASQEEFGSTESDPETVESEQSQGTTDAEEEKQLMFFEEESKYFDFAREFLKENGENLPKEEAYKILELQKEVRERYMPHLQDTDAENTDFLFNDPEQMEDKRFLNQEEAQNSSIEQVTSSSESNTEKEFFKVDEDADVLASLDFRTQLLQDRGTWEGQRRFERLDRVSQDAPNDLLDKLKLKMRHERVFDQVAAEFTSEHENLIKATLKETTDTTKFYETVDSDDTNIECDFEGTVHHTVKLIDSEVEVSYDGVQSTDQEGIAQAAQEWAPIHENIVQQTKHMPQLSDDEAPQLDILAALNIKESTEMINQAREGDAIIVAQSGLMGSIKTQYEQAQQVEKQILKYRKYIATTVFEAQKKLENIHRNHSDLVDKLQKYNALNVEQQIQPMPEKIDSILERRKVDVRVKNEMLKLLTKQKFEFNPKSNVAANYELELFTISKMGLLKTKKQKDELLLQYEFVFDCMKQNKVQLTPKIRAGMFEYLVVRNDFELANTQLKTLTSDLTESNSPIDTRYLSMYLKNCLQNDKIDGVAYLVNYCRRYNVDCSKMPLDKFHNMLDFYLNHSFDLSKVMIFSKFYKKYYEDKITNQLSIFAKNGIKSGQFSQEQQSNLKSSVFDEHENLVDMRALSKFLIVKTGDKQIIDPLTKEDSLWGLIDMFTQSPDMYEASRLSKNNHIEPSTIAQYFGNKLNNHDSLEKVIKIAFRLNQTNVGRDFSKSMLEVLKTYQSQRNGALPLSFTEEALKDIYYKIRASKSDLDLNTSELLLYILQSKGMHKEVIDYCERKQNKAEIIQYYLTESLLQLPLKSGSYGKALDTLLNASDACKLTQKTKAIMLDEGAEAAYSYFKDEFAKSEEKAKQSKAFLISLYDKMMPQQDVTFEDWKDKYSQSSQLAAKFAKEAYVVNQMEGMIKNKNYEEVDNLFNLYAVMREERLLLNHDVMLNQTQGEPNKNFQNKIDTNNKRLQAVVERKMQLQKKANVQDVETLDQISKVMKDQELTVFNEANADQIKQMAPIFSDLSVDEAASIEVRNKKLWRPEELTPDTVSNKLAEMGHDPDFIKWVFQQDLMYVTKLSVKQLPNNDRRVNEFRNLNKTQQGKILKLQKDYDKLMKQLDRPSEVLRLIKLAEKDPEFKQKTQNFMFGPGTDSDKEQPFQPRTEEQIKDLNREAKDGLIVEEYLGFNPMNIDSSSQEDEELNNYISTEQERDDEMIQQKQMISQGEINQMTEQQKRRKKLFSESDGEITEKLEKYNEAVQEYESEEQALEEKRMERLKLFLNHDGIVDFTETQSEEEVQKQIDEQSDLESRYADLKFLIGQQQHVTQDISDMSAEEDKVEPAKIMKDLWMRIEGVTNYYLEVNKKDYVQAVPDNEFFDGRNEKIFNAVMQEERDEYDNGWDDLGYQARTFQTESEEQDLESDDEEDEGIELPDKSQEKMEFDSFRDKLLYDPLDPEDFGTEPQVMRETIHDSSVFQLKEELIMAMNQRKYQALPIVIEVFNRIQRKTLGEAYILEDFENLNVREYTLLNENEKMDDIVDDIHIEDASETLKKLSLLLNDSRSPIISTLKDTSKYKTGKLPEDIDDYYLTPESYVRNALDIGAYERDLDKLKLLEFEIQRIQKTLQATSNRVRESIQNINRPEPKRHQNLESKQVQDKMEQRMRQMHNQFNSRTDKNSVSDETKIRVMRDILALELGQSFNVNAEEDKTANAFPVFYALDLINFGIKRNQPAAIRLGEKLLADSCDSEQGKLPKDLAAAVKNYMLDFDNNLKYREAMKITGPINSSKLYHMANQKPANQSSMCLDDPYWQDFILKNRRREDQWRNPSIFAYRYKPYGIIGEIIDMQHVEKRYEQVFGRK